ncbi:response regulator transcription factor [bacterium SCSIO 12741]|nr:response regulator transcription factor [bacterium SCSIO 12741]
MKINCVIIEDEPLAMERLVTYVEKLPQLQLKATFSQALEGMDYLKQHPTDLLFLDINLDEISGIQLLENIRFEGEVVLTTAYDQYALKGYELQVTDYLLKPFGLDRFVQAVDKVQQNLLLKAGKSDQEFVFIKTENRLEKVMLDEILYVEGMRDYRRIHTTRKRIMTLQTFSEMESLIPTQKLIRVHKSWMVAPSKIDSIERNRIQIGEIRIPISDSYRKDFFERITL